jgi:NitT/TauT family transport system substrate-binding protein
VPGQIHSGAFEDMAKGRSSDVSCACHWAVNAAAAAHHGRMYGNGYSVCPSGIFVPAESPYRQPADLAWVEVSVGFHSGSHYSALQGLEPFLQRDQIALHFAGRPNDRLRAMLDGRIEAANVWGGQYYLLEQIGFRKLVDTTFVMGFLVSPDAENEDVERYFRALLLAQQEIDIDPERYKHSGSGDAGRLAGPGRCPALRAWRADYPQPLARCERAYRWMKTGTWWTRRATRRLSQAVLATQ